MTNSQPIPYLPDTIGTTVTNVTATWVNPAAPQLTPLGTIVGGWYQSPPVRSDLPYVIEVLARLLEAGKLSEESFKEIVRAVAQR